MQLKNVIFDVAEMELPKLKFAVNPAEFSADDTVVVCDDNQKIRKWRGRGFACVGVEDKGRIPADYVTDGPEGIDEDYLLLVFCRTHGLPMNVCETERLMIREMTMADLPALYEIYQGSVLEYAEPLYAYEEERAFTESYIKNMYGFYGYGLWLLVRKADGRIIGRAGLSNRQLDGRAEIELGYIVGEQFQGLGYAMEACRAILNVAFEKIGAKRVIACIEKENVPSLRLAQKLGFSKVDKEWGENPDVYELYCPLTERTY